jgi:hypothetical protein
VIVKALVTVIVVAALAAGLTRGAVAEDASPTPTPATAPEGTPAAAPSPDPAAPPAPEQRLVVHGYLSQAYVKSDGHQVIGIPKDGTADYRRAALLFRASLTTSDALVLQFAQRRLGDSPPMQVEPDVKVDWAFYEHRFGSATRFRVGRMPVPLGIFSEVRYVGTLLPFYRAPYNFYQEGSFTSENLDGAHLSHTFGTGGPVSVDVNAFGGAFTTIEAYNGGVNRAKAQNVFGGAAWIGTPIDGLRFGIGGMRHDVKNTILTDNHRDNWSNWIASGELVRTRFRLSTATTRSAMPASRSGTSTPTPVSASRPSCAPMPPTTTATPASASGARSTRFPNTPATAPSACPTACAPTWWPRRSTTGTRLA